MLVPGSSFSLMSSTLANIKITAESEGKERKKRRIKQTNFSPSLLFYFDPLLCRVITALLFATEPILSVLRGDFWETRLRERQEAGTNTHVPAEEVTRQHPPSLPRIPFPADLPAGLRGWSLLSSIRMS